MVILRLIIKQQWIIKYRWYRLAFGKAAGRGPFVIKSYRKSDLYNVILNVAPRTVKYQDADYDTFRSALLINPTIPVMDPEQPGKYTQITTYSTNNPVEILKLEKSGGERTILT